MVETKTIIGIVIVLILAYQIINPILKESTPFSKCPKDMIESADNPGMCIPNGTSTEVETNLKKMFLAGFVILGLWIIFGKHNLYKGWVKGDKKQ